MLLVGKIRVVTFSFEKKLTYGESVLSVAIATTWYQFHLNFSDIVMKFEFLNHRLEELFGCHGSLVTIFADDTA